MTSWAAHEREALVEALTAVGPDAPTLCEGWTAADLAAHCYVREHRPDAAAGVLPLGPLSAYTDRVMRSTLRVHGFDEIVRRLRQPPPWLRIGPLDDVVNTGEYLIHTEDVRRPNGLPARDLPEGLERAVAARLAKQARLSFRRVPLRVRLEPTVGAPVTVGKGDDVVIRSLPSELLLFAYNRKADARVDIEGTARAVDILQGSKIGL